MSAKNRDNKNRWRNITVGFRVSPEENELINKAVALSGLPKQEYCYRRCLIKMWWCRAIREYLRHFTRNLPPFLRNYRGLKQEAV